MASEVVTTQRDVRAIEIPGGSEFTIASGSRLMITQKLGGTFTVMSEEGYLARIDGEDADALGLEAPVDAGRAAGKADGPLEERIWDELKSVYDPEIPVNVVELGLIYQVEVLPALDGYSDVFVKMTMTAPGCGMGDILRDEIERKIAAQPDVRSVDVEFVFEPPWDPSMMSEAARLQLGMF